MELGIAFVIGSIGRIKTKLPPTTVDFDTTLFKINDQDPVRFRRFATRRNWAEFVEKMPSLSRLMSLAGPLDRLTPQANQFLIEQATVLVNVSEAAPPGSAGLATTESVKAAMSAVAQLQPAKGARVGVRAVRQALKGLVPNK